MEVNMNNRITGFISNLSYTLAANIITFLVSVIIIAVVPKILGVEEFGYFQLYIFYTSYVIFFHFGLPNGIYLRYGGKDYSRLDKNVLTTQFWMITAYTLLLAVIGSIIIFFTIGDEKKEFILIMTCLCGVIILPRDFILLMFQATNRIKDYVIATIIDRFVFVAITVIFLFLGVRDYSFLIKADIIGKLFAMGWIIYLCRDMIFQKLTFVREGIKEAAKT
jgi:O-antigen/teichoic acid export membrane protein